MKPIKGKARGNLYGGAIIVAVALVGRAFGVAPLRYSNSVRQAEFPVLFEVAFWSIFAIGAGAMIYGLVRLLRGLD
ncbi:MAG: hypothetical protein R3229_13755 [Alphaproteobacteria bacterium]|nr:hypothetical protein [Alphaproteobacteria bacterium]